MSDKPRILLQIDPDAHASVFDEVVAIDAGVDHLLVKSGVRPEQVEALVHGAIFTRGGDDLARTAIFIGGTNVAAGEALLHAVTKAFFGPMRVSVMLDANGANTTAAAAVWRASKHLALTGANALVLGGTGPVGQRAARLLAGQGADVKLASRSAERAADAAAVINTSLGCKNITGIAPGSSDALADALQNTQVVISAGAAGAQLLPAAVWQEAKSLKVVIDLNAVPPVGVEGVEVFDKAVERDGVITYGAIGVGGTKMKIHKAAIRSLFDANDRVLDADAVFALTANVDA